jgi:uncharacterized repeat protein (TIGR01451 family)
VKILAALLLVTSVSAGTYTSPVCGSGSNNIPDAGTLACALTVAGSGSIATGNALTLSLIGLQHEASGDLIVTLTHFTDSSQTSIYGSPQVVFSRIGKLSADPSDFGYSAQFGDPTGTADNYDFGSSFPGSLWATAALLGAANLIPGRAQGFVGGYAPTAAFSSAATNFSAMFAGQPVAGVWRLDVTDNAPGPTVGSSGSLLQWALNVTLDSSPAPSLSIAKTHSGNFVQGQQNAAYTVTVANAANAGPTSGTVTVTDTPASGLMLASMSGSGWTCGATCSRSDVLNPGSSYPPITVAVNVAPNASSPLVNIVSVTGGASAPDSTTIVPAGQEIGFVDLAGDAQGGASVPKGATLYVQGWATDTAAGAPVQSVTVSIEGNSAGTATLGASRPDVAQAYNRNDYTNSGWTFQMSTSALSLGQHSIAAASAGPSGTGALLRSRTVNITQAGGQETGFVDLAGDAQGGSTVASSGTLYVQGWAADTASGAPVQTVTVFVGGTSMGTATLGSARPDVSQAFNRSDYTNSGWNFQMSAGALSIGQHSVTATASGPSGTAPLVGSRTITISGGQEIGFVDMAGDAQGGATVSQTGTLYVRGWNGDPRRIPPRCRQRLQSERLHHQRLEPPNIRRIFKHWPAFCDRDSLGIVGHRPFIENSSD